MKSSTFAYGKVAQAFHWGSAFLILGLIPLGLVMARLAESPLKTTLYRAHVGIGLLVLVITALRILWRFIDPTPEVPVGMSSLHRFGFKAAHFLLYFVLILLLLSGAGILLVSGLGLSPAGVLPEAIARDIPPLVAHRVLAWVYMLLLVGHLGGVFLHQFTTSGVLGRMGMGGLPGK